MQIVLVLSIIGALLAQGQGASVRSGSPLVAKFQEEIDFVMSLIPTGNEELGIPVLEPLALEPLSMKLEAKGLSVDASVSDAKVVGISSIKIESVKMVGDKVAVTVVIPSASGSGKYESDGKLKSGFISVPVNGKGPFQASVSDIKAVATFGAAMDASGKLSVDSVKIEYDVKDISIDLQGMYGGGFVGKTVNKVLNKMAGTLEKSFRAKIESTLETVIVEEAGKFLTKLQATQRGATLAQNLIVAAFQHFATTL